MACIISDSRNTSYDGNLSTVNGFYRVEAYNLGFTAGSSPALTATVVIPVTFANAGNCMGIVTEVYTVGLSKNDRTVNARLQEAKTVGSFNTSTEKVNIATHGIADGTVVCFTSTGTLPTGITANVHYYVVNGGADDFQISLTLGGGPIGLSGTPSGTATCWVTRATKSLDYTEIFGTFNESGVNGHYHASGYVPFDFATPYAVDTTANKWRFTFIQSGGTVGTFELLTSDAGALYPFFATWCDTKISHTDDDTLVVKDLVMIDKTASISGGLATGTTDYAVCGWICRNTDYSKDNVCLLKWKPEPVASYTFTIKGTLCVGTHSGFRVGTEAKPIPYAQMADIYFAQPTVGSITISSIQTASASRIKSSIFIYGQIPTLQKTTLASDAELLQAHLITTDDTSTHWKAGDLVVAGKQNTTAQGSLLVHEIQSISGTDITLTANLATAKRFAGGSVIRFNGYGVRMRGYTNALYGQIFTYNSSNFTVSGVESINFKLYPFTSTGYPYLDDLAYRGQYLIQDCSARYDSTTLAAFITSPFIPKEGVLINRINVFRGVICVTPVGYANSSLKSGYLEEKNCVVISKYNTTEGSANAAAQINFHDNRFENGTRHGVILQGLNMIFKDNYFWGLSGSTAGYYCVMVYQLINPVEISGNSYNNGCNCFGFTAYVTKNCVDKNSVFASEGAAFTGQEITFVAGALIDYEFQNPTNLTKIDLVNLLDVVPGSRLRLTDNGGVANDDINYLPDGYIVRTGTGLTDTTVHTAGTGKFAMRFESIGSPLAWEQKIPTGNIQNKDMAVSVWVKINNANYWSGANYQLPRLTITYDQTSVVYCQAAQTTDWQKLFVNLTPLTTFGELSCKIDGYTDVTGSDAYFYVDDYSILYPAGYALNLGSLDIWASGLPVTPTISTVNADAGSLWDALTANHTVTGSFGKQAGTLKNASYIIDGEIII